MREATKQFGNKLGLEKISIDGSVPFKLIQFIQLEEEVLVSCTIGAEKNDHFTETDYVLVYFDNLAGMAKNIIRTERYNIPKLIQDTPNIQGY